MYPKCIQMPENVSKMYPFYFNKKIAKLIIYFSKKNYKFQIFFINFLGCSPPLKYNFLVSIGYIKSYNAAKSYIYYFKLSHQLR